MKKKKGPEKPKVDAAPKFQPFAELKELRDKMKAAEQEAPKAPRPQAPKEKVRTAPVSDADLLSFHRMMSGVVPLAEAATRIPRSQSNVAPSRVRDVLSEGKSKEAQEADEVHEHLRRLVSDDARFEVVNDGVNVEGRRIDLPPHIVRTLRRGRLPIDARLDLHGKKAEEAERELITFLANQRARGERCVLVIHGKGAHSPDGRGVLRGEMAAWLSEGRASEHVGAFSTALPEDGGAGAMYVLLRR